MIEKRRNFLKKLGITAAGLGCGFPLLRALASERLEPHDAEEAPAKNQLSMIIDVRKCMGKEFQDACIKACHEAHNCPEEPWGNQRGFQWIWSEKYENAFHDLTHERCTNDVIGKEVLLLCNHCTNPSCVKVCPTGATWKRKDNGIVMMDMHRCIGCRYCMAGCPYGVRRFNWYDPRPQMKKDPHTKYPTREKGVVEKCNFCAERIAKGQEPACVEASKKLPGGQGAIMFGNLADPNSGLHRIHKEKHTVYRLGGMGTKPNVFYII